MGDPVGERGAAAGGCCGRCDLRWLGAKQRHIVQQFLVETIVLSVGGGLLGFLPVLGFWMIPLGFLVLSVDLPAVRRWRRKITVRLGAWLKRRYPNFAEKLGFNNGNSGPRNGVNRRS